MSLFGPPKHSHFWTAKPQDSNAKTAGNEPLKVSVLRGSILTRSLLGKTIHLRFGTVVQKRLRGPSGPDRGGRQGRLGDLELGWGGCWRCGGGFGSGWDGIRQRAGGFGGAFWDCGDLLAACFAGVKQNSSEAKPLSCEHLVGVTRFELVTSSVSGKRSPPELNARSRVRECAGNNITELPPGGKNYFKKLVICGPIGARRSANSTRKVPFVPPMNCTFA